MATEPDYTTLLRNVPLFSAIPLASLTRVIELASEITHDAGHVVVRQDAGAHALHVIIEGEASIEADGQHVATLGPGNYFGEIAVIDRSKRSASVVAVTRLRVLAIDAFSFRRLVKSDGELAMTMIDAMAARLRDLDEKLGD